MPRRRSEDLEAGNDDRGAGAFARGLALLGGLGALALPTLMTIGLFYDARGWGVARDDGTVSGALDDAGSRISAACAFTVIAPFALITFVTASAAIVESLTTARGRWAGSLALLYGVLSALLLVVVVPSALEVPEGLAAWAAIAVVFLVNLQAWRLARAASTSRAP